MGVPVVVLVALVHVLWDVEIVARVVQEIALSGVKVVVLVVLVPAH